MGDFYHLFGLILNLLNKIISSSLDDYFKNNEMFELKNVAEQKPSYFSLGGNISAYYDDLNIYSGTVNPKIISKEIFPFG